MMDLVKVIPVLLIFCFDVIGLEAAITDYKGAITLKNAKIVVESEDESMIQVKLPM